MPKLEEKSNGKKGKSILLILIMVILITAIIFFLIKYGFNYKEKDKIDISPWERPVFLGLSLPSVKNVEEAINNPLLQELEYHKKYFLPITPGAKGRPNPFAPF